jgi:hypothetical protein
MRTLTLKESRPGISEVLDKCENNPLVARRANEAQERLLNRPDKPVGSWARYRVCAGEDGCMAWPRQIQTIEAFAICSTPGVIRSEWFEFIGWPNGIGLQSPENMPGTMLIDRGTACSFDNVVATVAEPRRIAAIASNVADVDKKITLRYYTSTGQKKYTSIGGVVQEGQQLTLVAPGPPFPGNAANVTSSDVRTDGLYHVVKDVTDYPIYLYEYNPTPIVGPASITKMLAQYEPSETVPIYRKSFVPGFTSMGACAQATGDCTTNKQITALVKLQHVPVVVDNDPFVIGNLAALVLMVTAIRRERQNRFAEAATLKQLAREELDGELSSYLGDGMVSALKVEGDFGCGQPALASYWNW